MAVTSTPSCHREQPPGAEGWAAVLTDSNERGLVPAAYLRFNAASTAPPVAGDDTPPLGRASADLRDGDLRISDDDLAVDETDETDGVTDSIEVDGSAAGGGGGGDAAGAGSSPAEAEAVSEWLAYTTVLLAQADDAVVSAARC